MARRRRPRFVMMHKQVLESPEWKELSHIEKLLYIYVKAGYNGGNNGNIPFNYSKHEKEFASATIAKVLGGVRQKGTLIEKGWLEKERKGGRYRYKVFFRLTGRFDIIK